MFGRGGSEARSGGRESSGMFSSPSAREAHAEALKGYDGSAEAAVQVGLDRMGGDFPAGGGMGVAGGLCRLDISPLAELCASILILYTISLTAHQTQF